MTEQIPFRVSTSLKTIIGNELVTNPNIAIFELVKNSYDAFAPHVWIIFKNIKSNVDSSIIVVDDGTGMSKRDLVKKWLFLGYSDKRDEAEVAKLKRGPLGGRRARVFAGIKGIGRFSCDTLGSYLVLHSKKRGEHVINKLEVDWSEFDEDQKNEFQQMKAVYSTEKEAIVEEFNLADMECGTILQISRLRENWDNADKLRNLKRHLQRLVNPYVGANVAEDFTIEMRAEEFREDDNKAKASSRPVAIINGPVENFVFEKLGIKTTSIKTQVGKEEIVTRLTDKGNLVFELSETNTYKQLHDIDIRIFFLNQSAKLTFSKIMGMSPIEYGSVFLYKNEFRVHPYGDKGDDWLGLEARIGQGYRRYISKRSIIGTVLIKGEQDQFKEVSSRDSGIIKNEAYNDLCECVMDKAIKRLERYVEGVIEWDKATTQGTEEREEIDARSLELASKLVEGTKGPKTSITVGPALLQVVDASFTSRYPAILGNLESLSEHASKTKEKKVLETTIRSVKRFLAKSEKERSELASSLAAKEQENLFLARTLTPGTESMMGHIHSIKISAQDIRSSLDDLHRWAQTADVPSNVVDKLDTATIEIQKILHLANMATYANFDLSKTEMKSDAVNYIKQYLDIFKTKKDILGPIQFYNEEVVFVTVFRPVNLAVTLDNLLDNSRKNGAREVSIKFKKVGDELQVLYGDDGRGIDSQTASHIFELGFSTTGGSGLGLHQIRKIMREDGGDVTFIGNDKEGLGTGACFKVVIKGR